MPLHITITTPQKTILETQADEITIPTITGEITVLPSHVPLLSQLTPGELIIKRNNETNHLAVTGGFLEIGNDTVSILADYAIQGKDISLTKVQEAKDQAEKAMKEKGLEEADLEALQTELRRTVLELKIANKTKHTRNI